MKRFILFTSLMLTVFFLASCGKDNYKRFVGTWGVDRIDYYNIDYAGNPIAATIETYDMTPGDPDNGIDLIFRDNKTGEMHDRSRDTLFIPIIEADTIFSYDTIICPDTTLVTNFSYSYDSDDGLLYMNMKVSQPFTFRMEVTFVDDNTFVYVNEYEANYVEKARLVRISNEARGAKRSKPDHISRHVNSLLTGER